MVTATSTLRTFAPSRCPACGEPSEDAFYDRLRITDGFLVLACRGCAHQVLRACPPLPYDSDDEFEPVVLERYIKAMKQSRQAAARTMLEAVAAKRAGHGTLLDIGASFGWLVEEALRMGWQAEGIEPSSIASESAQSKGLPVLHGFFPDDMPRDGRLWDVITLMDVLEHLEDPLTILSEIRGRLSRNGVLALQVPDSRGLFLRTSECLARISSGRFVGPLLRMYQTQFPYPHLHYFHPGSMERLLSRAGFETIQVRATQTIVGATSDRVGYLKTEYSGTPARGLAARAVAWSSSAICIASSITGLHDTFYCIARPC